MAIDSESDLSNEYNPMTSSAHRGDADSDDGDGDLFFFSKSRNGRLAKGRASDEQVSSTGSGVKKGIAEASPTKKLGPARGAIARVPVQLTPVNDSE